MGAKVVLPLIAALTLTAGLVAQQTGTVSGAVVADGGAPLAGARVTIVGTARSALTNPQGQYQLTVSAGTHTVRVRLTGYQPAEQRVTVTAGATATADFELAANSPAVEQRRPRPGR